MWIRLSTVFVGGCSSVRGSSDPAAYDKLVGSYWVDPATNVSLTSGAHVERGRSVLEIHFRRGQHLCYYSRHDGVACNAEWHLSGDRIFITFSDGRARFDGKIVGSTIEGIFIDFGNEKSIWHLRRLPSPSPHLGETEEHRQLKAIPN